MAFLSNVARMAYEANLGLMLLSILLSFIEPFLNVYGYLPPSVASQLQDLNLISYLNSVLPSAFSVLRIIAGVSGLALGGYSLLKLTSLNNVSLNINSNIVQAVEVTLLYIIAQFVFGGFPWFALFLDNLVSNASTSVPGVELIISQLTPGITTVINMLSGIFEVLSFIYILEIYGITI